MKCRKDERPRALSKSNWFFSFSSFILKIENKDFKIAMFVFFFQNFILAYVIYIRARRINTLIVSVHAFVNNCHDCKSFFFFLLTFIFIFVYCIRLSPYYFSFFSFLLTVYFFVSLLLCTHFNSSSYHKHLFILSSSILCLLLSALLQNKTKIIHFSWMKKNKNVKNKKELEINMMSKLNIKGDKRKYICICNPFKYMWNKNGTQKIKKDTPRKK